MSRMRFQRDVSVAVGRRSTCGLDQTVISIASSIQDIHLLSLGVSEYKKRVTQEAHMDGGFVRRERLHSETLGLDDAGAVF